MSVYKWIQNNSNKELINNFFPLPETEFSKIIDSEPFKQNLDFDFLVSRGFLYLLNIKIMSLKKITIKDYGDGQYDNDWELDRFLNLYLKSDNYKEYEKKIIKSEYEFYTIYIDQMIKNDAFQINDDLIESVIFFAYIFAAINKKDLNSKKIFTFKDSELNKKAKEEIWILANNSLDNERLLGEIQNNNSIFIKKPFTKILNNIGLGSSDLIIGDLIIDIRHINSYTMTEEIWNKLIICFILYNMSGIKINRIGIFSSKNYFKIINLWDLFNKNNLTAFISYLTKYNVDFGKCPDCKDGILVNKKNYTGHEFIGCSNFDKRICSYIQKDPINYQKTYKKNFGKCPKCKTGWLIIKNNKWNDTEFIGCSNYRINKCDYSENINNNKSKSGFNFENKKEIRKENDIIKNKENDIIKNKENDIIKNKENDIIKNKENDIIKNKENDIIKNKENDIIKNKENDIIKNKKNKWNSVLIIIFFIIIIIIILFLMNY